MPESAMRAALLQQDGVTSIETELELLKALVQSENHRVRRLRWWTITVWVAFAAIVAMLIIVWPLTVAQAPGVMDGGQPPIQPGAGGIGPGVAVTFVLLAFLGLLGLPPVGVVLLILWVLAQRSASVSQLRASVAAIDAQLRLLAKP